MNMEHDQFNTKTSPNEWYHKRQQLENRRHNPGSYDPY